MERISVLHDLMVKHGLRGMAINPGPSMLYLTGLRFHLSERPTLLLLNPRTKPVLILPELELPKLSEKRGSYHLITFGDDPTSWPAVFHRAGIVAALEGQEIGIEPVQMRYLEGRLLEESVGGCRLVPRAELVNEMRMVKGAREVAAIQKAVQIAQDALEAILPELRVGMSERQVASLLVASLQRSGSGNDLPFTPIVASGPNSANPHAHPGDRELQTGDLVVIDWGASWDGYCSDLTRTFAVGEVDEEFKRIHSLVEKANAAGREAVVAGRPLSAVDMAARAVITEGGYGPFFTHRTGHGLGMEGHEPPYVYGANTLPMVSGMTFTVEPGIYLTERGGVRVEDNVVVGEEGCVCLSDMPRELRVIG